MSVPINVRVDRGDPPLTSDEDASLERSDVFRMSVRSVNHRRELEAARLGRERTVQKRPRLPVHGADEEHHLRFFLLPRPLLNLLLRARLACAPCAAAVSVIYACDSEWMRLQPERREGEERVLPGLPPAQDSASQRNAHPVRADGRDAGIQRRARARICIGAGARAEDEVKEHVPTGAEKPVECPDRPHAPHVNVVAFGSDVDVQRDEEHAVGGTGVVSMYWV